MKGKRAIKLLAVYKKDAQVDLSVGWYDIVLLYMYYVLRYSVLFYF